VYLCLVALPMAPAPGAPRYSERPLPPYPFVPGEGEPHPHVDPAGHGVAPPGAPAGWRPARWADLEAWRYAVDLYNHGFWWECHEALEALWRAAERDTAPARFVQGLILVSAACLNRRRGSPAAADQACRGVARIESVDAPGGRYMGLAIDPFAREVRRFFAGDAPAPPPILLAERRR